MELSLSKEDLQSYVASQVNNFFPDKKIVRLQEFGKVFDIALDRLDYCFKRMAYERYNKAGQTLFNHLYSDQYLEFIWFLSNTIWKETGNDILANKLYYLNKTLHSFDCMYNTKLPDIFFISHGIGTMLGKAVYSDYFISMHGCTIGAHNGKYPVLGVAVTLTAHSSVIGDCNIGNNVSIANNTNIFERDVPAGSLVFNDPDSGKIITKASRSTFARQVFKFET